MRYVKPGDVQHPNDRPHLWHGLHEAKLYDPSLYPKYLHKDGRVIKVLDAPQEAEQRALGWV